MAGQKPNTFPQRPLPLTGAEEVYTQLGGINEKFTVDNISDYVLALVSGSTDDDWIEGSGVIYNNTNNIGIGTDTPQFHGWLRCKACDCLCVR